MHRFILTLTLVTISGLGLKLLVNHSAWADVALDKLDASEAPASDGDADRSSELDSDSPSSSEAPRTARLPMATDWMLPDAEAITALESGIVAICAQDLAPEDFATGTPTFDGEWYFGTYLTAGIGFAQLALAEGDAQTQTQTQTNEDHARAAARRQLVRDCVDRLLTPTARAFTAAEWGSDPIDALDDPTQHHAAYLGYFSVLLGLERCLDPDGPHAALHDRLIAAMVTRLNASPNGVLQTYPGEAYPVDVSTVVAGIALHQRATGTDHRATLERWVAQYRSRMIDETSGLLIQALNPTDASPSDLPRGSGTLFGAYFLSFVDAELGTTLSADLWAAAKAELLREEVGRMGMREYRSGVNGPMDIDSGEIISGLGTSATGFAIGLARIHGDHETQRGLLRLAYLLGGPLITDGQFRFQRVYPLSNTMFFAMVTAERMVDGP